MRQLSRTGSISWPGCRPIRTPLKATLCARASMLIMLMVAVGSAACAQNQVSSFVLERNDRMIVLEPYADNIVRITMSTAKSAALGAPGYGIVGTPSMTGWTHERESDGYDVIRSGRLIIRVAPENLPPPHTFPLDALNQSLRDHYFGGSGNGQAPYNNIISIATSSGKPLLNMLRWSMFPTAPEHRLRVRATAVRRALATAFPRPLTRRRASIITDSASSSKGFSIYAITASNAGTITPGLEERTSAFLS